MNEASIKRALNDIREIAVTNLLTAKNDSAARAAGRLLMTPALEEVFAFLIAETERPDSGATEVLIALENFAVVLLTSFVALLVPDELAERVLTKATGEIRDRCLVMGKSVTAGAWVG